MIDSLRRLLPAARARAPRARLGLEAGAYVLVTLHRPALVDDARVLQATVDALGEIAERLPVALPIHPRTRAQMERSGIGVPSGVVGLEPLGYLDFIALEADARLVITDSGGVQEETTALGVPCLTVRTTTERPITVTHGTNAVIGFDPAAMQQPLWKSSGGPFPYSRP